MFDHDGVKFFLQYLPVLVVCLYIQKYDIMCILVIYLSLQYLFIYVLKGRAFKAGGMDIVVCACALLRGEMIWKKETWPIGVFVTACCKIRELNLSKYTVHYIVFFYITMRKYLW